jgi:hypothetical protein
MANKLMRKLGFGDFTVPEYQLFGTSSGTPSSSYTSPSTTSQTPSSDTGVWAGVAATAITVAGQVASSVFTPQPQTPVVPAYPGMPAGSVAGSIDSKILLIGGIAILGILMMSMRKS